MLGTSRLPKRVLFSPKIRARGFVGGAYSKPPFTATGPLPWGSNLGHRFLWKIADYPDIDVEAFIEEANSARSCTLIGDRFYVGSDVAPAIHEEFGVH